MHIIKITFRKLLLFFLTVVVFSACNSVKNLTYFQKSKGYLHDTLSVARFYIPKIQIGDLLSVSVNSLSPDASSFFNPYSGGAIGSSASNSGASSGISQLAAPGYLVDATGSIELPLIGNMKVTGYTTSQLRDTLKSHLKIYLKEPTVVVRFLNFKITMLGEVSRPQVYNIPNEMITLPEAISMAGDLTDLARRDSVEIIRDVDGRKETGFVNMNTREVFNSPYYYLHANDLIYVKPSKYKAQHNDRYVQFISLGTSLISIYLILFRK